MDQFNQSRSSNHLESEAESKGGSCDEPLFVLKYRKGDVILQLVFFIAILFLYGLCIYGIIPGIRILGILGFTIGFPFFLEMLMFREIRLYKDRIAKVWYFIGKKEIKLADAQLKNIDGPGRSKVGPCRSFKRILPRHTNVLLSDVKGIFYDEKLARPDDVKKLNLLLAGLTGRSVEELETPYIRIDGLIKP